MIPVTTDCIRPTEFNVIQIIHCNVGISVFVHLPKCLFVIIVTYLYFIHISQGSVMTHLRCGGIYNNHIIANCLQSVPVEEFLKLANNW